MHWVWWTKFLLCQYQNLCQLYAWRVYLRNLSSRLLKTHNSEAKNNSAIIPDTKIWGHADLRMTSKGHLLPDLKSLQSSHPRGDSWAVSSGKFLSESNISQFALDNRLYLGTDNCVTVNCYRQLYTSPLWNNIHMIKASIERDIDPLMPSTAVLSIASIGKSKHAANKRLGQIQSICWSRRCGKNSTWCLRTTHLSNLSCSAGFFL